MIAEGFVEMGLSFRQSVARLNKKIADDKVDTVEALRCDIFGAQPEYSITQVSEHLDESPDTLYKACEGKRKFPPEKLGALACITGTTHTIESIARQCGGFFVPYPSTETVDYRNICDTLRTQCKLIEGYADIYQDGIVDDQERREKVPAVLSDIDAHIAAVLGLRAKLETDADELGKRRKGVM